MTTTKTCQTCGTTFTRDKRCSFDKWERARFCSRPCKDRARYLPNRPAATPDGRDPLYLHWPHEPYRIGPHAARRQARNRQLEQAARTYADREASA